MSKKKVCLSLKKNWFHFEKLKYNIALILRELNNLEEFAILPR